MPDWLFLKRCLTILAIVVGAVVVWRLRDVELLVFSSILLAMLFRLASEAIETRLHLTRAWSLLASLLVIIAILAGAIAFSVFRLQSEVVDLAHRLPSDLQRLEQTLAGSPLGRMLDAAARQAQPARWLGVGQLKGYVASAGTLVLDVVLVLVAAIYLAAQPGTYRSGLVRLFPDHSQAPLERWLESCAWFLRRWMLAQLAAMISIGILAGVGLTILGIPSSAALGLFAALAEFIPLFGPILAAVPALVVALASGWVPALEVAGLFVGIHLLEANLIQPFLQRRFASLPPVVSIFALLVFGSFFGALGIVLAAPLAIVALVSVRVLYLGDDLTPGEVSPHANVTSPVSKEPGTTGRQGARP